MATKSDIAEIAVLQEQGKTMKQDIQEIKSDVKAVLDRFDKLDDRYPTRRELNVLRWVVGVLIAAVSVIATLLAAFGSHVK